MSRFWKWLQSIIFTGEEIIIKWSKFQMTNPEVGTHIQHKSSRSDQKSFPEPQNCITVVMVSIVDDSELIYRTPKNDWMIICMRND